MAQRLEMFLQQNSCLLTLPVLLDSPRSVPSASFGLPLHSLLLVLPYSRILHSSWPVSGPLHLDLDDFAHPDLFVILYRKEDWTLLKYLVVMIQHLEQPARFLARFPDPFASTNHADNGRGFQS